MSALYGTQLVGHASKGDGGQGGPLIEDFENELETD